MCDSQVLGVSNEHGTRLLCVLGANREVFGLVCNRGEIGCNTLLQILQGVHAPDSEEAHSGQDAVLVDFVPLQELDQADKAVIKAVGFKRPAGRLAFYPRFRSHKPGYLPWFLEEAEALMAADSLKKAAAFSALVLRHPDLYDDRRVFEFPFYPEDDHGTLSADQLVWNRLLPRPIHLEAVVDPKTLNLSGLSNLPVRDGAAWELHAAFTFIKIAEGNRPFLLRLAMGVDGNSGGVMAFESGGPDQPLAVLAALCLLKCLRLAAWRPQILVVKSENLEQALKPLAETLRIKCHREMALPALEMAWESMTRYME